MILEAIDRWLTRLFSNAELRPYETACVEAWKKQLPERPRDVLEAQLSRFDNVERLADDKQVRFWCLKEKTSQWPDAWRFPAGTEQGVEAATVWLRKQESRSRARLRADMIVVNGRFFSIEFNKQPLAYFGPGKESSDDPVVDEVTIRYDLSHEGSPAAPLTDTGGLKGWLAECDSQRQLSEVLEPQSEGDRKELLRGFDTVFPDDYLEAMAQVGGFRVGACKVLGLGEVWKVVDPDQSFYVFAEAEHRAYFGVAQGATMVEIYRLDEEFEVPEPLESKSIRAVLENELQAEDD